MGRIKFIYIIIFCFLLQNYDDIFCQNLVISAGTNVIGSGGKCVIKSNIINNGSFTNTNNLVDLSGSVQSLEGNFPVSFENLTVEPPTTATVNRSGQTISGILLSDGTLNSNGNITLLSVKTRTALIDGSGSGQVLGDITIQRYLASGFGYKYFSSPFQTATVNEFADNIDLGSSSTTFYRYNENRVISGTPASGWVNYKSTSNILEPLAGYAVNFGSASAPVTVDVTGVVNNGSLSTTLYNHDNPYTLGFNLIGNPFPSPIDWDAPSGWTRINIDNALYFFKADSGNQYQGAYITYINGISSDGLATNIIPSMQGFFVHVQDVAIPATGTLALNNNVRVNDQIHTFIKSGRSETPSYVRIEAGYSDDTVSYDPLCIYFDVKATNNFDGQFDALKLFNTDPNIPNFYLFGDDGSRLSIDALALTDSSFCNIRLGLKTGRNGDVVFKVKDIVGEFLYKKITITDITSGTTHDLVNGSQFIVNLTAGDYQDRFFLNLSNNITGVAETIADPSWFTIYSSHGIVMTDINLSSCDNGTLKIYNLMGIPVKIFKIYQPGHHEFSPALKAGIYIVTFCSGSYNISKKIFLQN